MAEGNSEHEKALYLKEKLGKLIAFNFFSAFENRCLHKSSGASKNCFIHCQGKTDRAAIDYLFWVICENINWNACLCCAIQS